jgi:3-oxoacyl-[acyl-carrier-protein] synthase-3
MPVAINQIAHYLPPETEVVGVRRPIAIDPGGPSDLALGPAQQVLQRAGLGADAVDFIIFATMTPDVTFPGSACFFQHKLGCGTVGALDARAQCAGFLMGLMIAEAFIDMGTYNRVLLAAAEVHSSGLDYSQRGAALAALYGDGASVVLLGRARGDTGSKAIVCHTDGRLYDRFWCEYPASRQHPVRVTVENLREGRHFPSLDRGAVETFGREHLPSVVSEALHKAGIDSDRIDCFILSHILPEVVESSVERLAVPASKFIDAGASHGHLTAAALPTALSEAVESGRLGPGANVCLAACGAGFAYGAAVLQL